LQENILLLGYLGKGEAIKAEVVVLLENE